MRHRSTDLDPHIPQGEAEMMLGKLGLDELLHLLQIIYGRNFTSVRRIFRLRLRFGMLSSIE